MRKPLWRFRAKLTTRYRIHSLVAITTAFVIDRLAADYIIDFLGIPDGTARNLLDTYFAVPLVAGGIYLAAFFNQEQKTKIT